VQNLPRVLDERGDALSVLQAKGGLKDWEGHEFTRADKTELRAAFSAEEKQFPRLAF
jgi:hypothetical protein